MVLVYFNVSVYTGWTNKNRYREHFRNHGSGGTFSLTEILWPQRGHRIVTPIFVQVESFTSDSSLASMISEIHKVAILIGPPCVYPLVCAGVHLRSGVRARRICECSAIAVWLAPLLLPCDTMRRARMDSLYQIDARIIEVL